MSPRIRANRPGCVRACGNSDIRLSIPPRAGWARARCFQTIYRQWAVSRTCRACENERTKASYENDPVIRERRNEAAKQHYRKKKMERHGKPPEVDEKRCYGCDQMKPSHAFSPSYTTIDARYAYRMGGWEAAVSALNLADRQYYSNAFGCRSGIYPSDGRQLKLSLRYDF